MRCNSSVLVRVDVAPDVRVDVALVDDKTAYHQEIMRQLADGKFYKPLTKDPTTDHHEQVRQAVASLLEKGTINPKTAKDLVEAKVETPAFYILPKIHKRIDNPPGRPIVSSNRAPTERISAFVDITLKPLVSLLPSYIKDTKDFLQKLQRIGPLPSQALLFTMDVVGLYNNIPHKDGLDA